MEQTIITAALTVFGGIVVFFLGQVILVLFIERIRIQARTIEEIAEAVVKYAPEYLSPLQTGDQLTPERLKELRSSADHLRTLSARLQATAVTLKYYRFFEEFALVLPKKNVIEASRNLMGLSNLIPPTFDTLQIAINCRKGVQDHLGIKVPER